jgi:hypothetical protein
MQTLAIGGYMSNKKTTKIFIIGVILCIVVAVVIVKIIPGVAEMSPNSNRQVLSKIELLQKEYPGCEIDFDSAGAAMIVRPDGSYFFLSAQEIESKWRQQ